MLKGNIKMTGRYKIRSHRAGTKELLRETGWVENLIVSGSAGYGRNILLRQMSGDTTYPLQIDSAKIGTGTTAPVDSDTDLETIVLSGISVASTNLSNDQCEFDFFMTDAQLANGTYKEFGLFMNGRLFARSLVSPVHTKSANEDTTVSYVVTFSAT